MKKYAIAIHGGAGTIKRAIMAPEREIAYRKGLVEAINCADDILKNGGSAMDAVEAAVVSLENDPLFNAGKGAVFSHNGKNELDASIMNGSNLMAGAVASVRNIKNPIKLARAVMENSEHVFLAGEGASEFAKLQNIEFAPDEYFFVQHRYDQWKIIQKEGDGVILDHTEIQTLAQDKKFGTVGAVALDMNGNLAAATSTGGMTNKKYGRIGDSPVIGASTYANNRTCAVSSTGHGEYFLRSIVAYDISCLMEYKGLSLNEACNLVVKNKLVKLGGEGGLVALDPMGNVELVFNSEGMYRAMKRAGEEIYTGIYGD